MSWRTAKSLLRLRHEVDAFRPDRDKSSDGTIGDADHQKRTSDHNPWVPPPDGGVVTAMDFTDDRGTLGLYIAEFLRASKDDRVKYVISEGRMFSSYATSRYPAWSWRPYSGPNGHFSHTHVSVQPHNYDNDRPWGLHDYRQEEEGMEELIMGIQRAIKDAGYDPGPIDGDWGTRTQEGLTAALRGDEWVADMATNLKKIEATPTTLVHVVNHHRAQREAYPELVKPGP